MLKFNTLFTLILAGLLGFLTACSSNEVSNVEDLNKYINKEENGLNKTKYVDGLAISLKYFSPEYQTYLELHNDNVSKHYYDSILNIYKQSLTFVLTIAADERKGKKDDIMYKDVQQFNDYVERFREFNFSIDSLVTLTVGNVVYTPILFNKENTYGLVNKHNVILTFVPKSKEDKTLYNSSKYEILFKDKLFNTGNHYFVIKQEDIKHSPNLDFNKIK